MLKAAHVRKLDGRWTTVWTQSGLYDRVAHRQIQRQATAERVDAVLQMMDYAVTAQPYGVYQDLSHGLLLRRFDQGSVLPDEFNRLSLDHLRRGEDRQHLLYARSTAIFCMSQWLARDITANGIDTAKVHVVNPGVAASVASSRPVGRPRTGKLLLVGSDARRKGLKEVVDSLKVLRQGWPEITLTVVGPATWPLDGPVPANVDFVGPLSHDRVLELMPRHDLYVMPSQWEGFGMAFCEALLAGLPCIGRDDCAMPEIIRAPEFGLVVGEPGELRVDPVRLAEAVDSVLRDDAVYTRVADARERLREQYSWDTAATCMLDVLGA